MLHYGLGRTFSSTTTTTNSPESSSERTIRRLRLTLHAGDDANKEPRSACSDPDGKDGWTKRNGLIQRERPAGRESPKQHLGDMTNGLPEPSLQQRGPKMYGVVQRNNTDRQQEVMAREWNVHHLHDEMKYIREVRDSLEKVRERMYGQFGGMQQSVHKLSQEIRVANSHRRNLESEVKVRTAAMEKFDQMNSSLISANIGLQKSLLENCQTQVDVKEDMKNLRSTCERTQEQLKDRERELAAAHAENQNLRLQVESSREANSKALMELSMTLQRDYEQKLLEEQRKHREEIEILQAQLDEYIRRLEEAELNIKIAEAKIAERDERICELERLLDCMGKEKSQLQLKLQECERRLRLLELSDTTDGAAVVRSKDLQNEAGSLRERIKHLNDMVFCQQRKVKGMIEEVQTLRAQVAQKDMFISELLDRIAIVECENNELGDKLKYFMCTQNREQDGADIGEKEVFCNVLPRVEEVPWHDVELPILPELSQLELNHLHPIEHLPPDPSPFAIPPPPQMSPPLPPEPPLSPTQHPLPPLPSSPTPPSSPTQTTPPIQPPSSPTDPSSPPPIQQPSLFLTMPSQPRTFRPNNPPPSRLESSLLRYTPVEYSRFLESNPTPQSEMFHCSQNSFEFQTSESEAGDEVDAQSQSDQDQSSTSSRRARPRIHCLDTPFLKLMEITANINIQ